MSWINAARHLQKQAYDYAKDTIPYEVLQSVLTARQFNNTIRETDLTIQEGKKRQLKINYYAPDCDVEGSCDANVCDPGNVIQPKQMWFEISRCTATKKISLNKDDIRYDDGMYTFSDHARFQIAAGLNSARKLIAQDVADLLVANAGLLPDGETARLLPWVDKSTGAINPMGLWEIERTFRDAGLSNPFIVGGSDVFYWKKGVALGGMNDLGQNVAQMGRTNAWYDTLINDAVGNTNSEHVIAFDPQILKFVSWNKNAGMFATDLKDISAIDAIYQRGGTDYIEGVLLDPVTGLLWDLYVNYDKCTHQWTFYYELTWDIFFLPMHVCGKQGVNGIFHFTTCPQLRVTCPSGSPLTPVSATVFEYETSGNVDYPLIIQKLEVAGVTDYPNTTVANIDQLIAAINGSAPSPLVFSKDGTLIEFTGYAGVTVQINDTLTMTFTEQ